MLSFTRNSVGKKEKLKGGGSIFGPPLRFVVFGEKKPPLGAAEIKIFR